MEASVDTLVYQLEDEDAVVRYETLQKLRKIAAVERSHFPVRNPRRFLQCLRRRIVDDEPQNADEALNLVSDVMGMLGDNLDQILTSILPHLISSLPDNTYGQPKTSASGDKVNDDDAMDHVLIIHEKTFQVFRKYVNLTNDWNAVTDLLVNMGLAHGRALVREASLVVIMRLLEERHARKKSNSRVKLNTVNRADKTLFISLIQAIIPTLEDSDEHVVIAAEEALAKLEIHWGGGYEEVMHFLSSEDKCTLSQHQEHIAEFLRASATSSPTSSTAIDESSPTVVKDLSASLSAVRQSSEKSQRLSPDSTKRQPSVSLCFGFVPSDVLDIITKSTGNSNSEWKKRSAAVEKLFTACKEADAVQFGSHIHQLEELFNVAIQLMQDVDVHIVKRGLQIVHTAFHKFSQLGDDECVGDKTHSGDIKQSVAQYCCYYMETLMPFLVEAAANYVDDEQMHGNVYAVFAQLFRGGFISTAKSCQTLITSLQHRRTHFREEALKVWMVWLLVAKHEGFSMAKLFNSNLLHCLGRLLCDSSVQVRELAFETVATIMYVTHADMYTLLEDHLDEETIDRIDMDFLYKRLQQKDVPSLSKNGQLILAKGKREDASRVDRIAPEKSLDSLSELQILASKDYPVSLSSFVRRSYEPSRGPSIGDESQQDILARSTCPEHVDVATRNQPSSSESTRKASESISAGSMSDRSYFLQSNQMTYSVNSTPSTLGNSSIYEAKSREEMMTKLSALKKKASQIRKSSSTMHTNHIPHDTKPQDLIAGNIDCEAFSRNSSMISQFSPGATSEKPLLSRREKDNRASNVLISKVDPESQHSPQRLQQIQSSTLTNENDLLESRIAENHDQGGSSSVVQAYSVSYLDDRPIRPMGASSTNKLAEYPDQQDNNQPERKGKQQMMSLATRKRLEGRQYMEAQARDMVNGVQYDEEYHEADKSDDGQRGQDIPAPPISLATRKRLEAKAKQDAQVNNPTSRENGAGIDKENGETFQSKMVTKKPSFAGKASTGLVSKEDNSRPTGFTQQEPRYLEQHEIKLLGNPKQDVAKLISQLQSSDWEVNFDAINIVRRLATHHAFLLEDKIHAVVTELLKQVQNLRSSVSKNALLALDSMCSTFRKTMDAEVDNVVPVLMKRCTDSNAFVCDSASASINSVILNCSTMRVVNAIAVHLSSKAVPIRREVARSMHTLIVSLADQIQSSKELPIIMNVVGKCLDDSSSEVRDIAKQSILYLMQEQHIDVNRLKKIVPAGVHGKIDQLSSAKNKYIATTAIPNAQTANVPTIDSSLKATNLADAKRKVPKSSNAASSAVPATATISGASGSRKGSALDCDMLARIQLKLDSNNWKDRYDALDEATAMIQASAPILCESGKIMGIFDVLIKRMEDGNSKVNVFALECLEKMIPSIGNGMELVLSSFIPSLAKNLAASNARLSSLAQSVIQVLCMYVDARLLCQHFATLARHSNSRIKPLLIETLDQLASRGDDKTQFALNRYVLPLAIELMKEAKSDVKDANTRLLRTLYATLGPTMLQTASKLSSTQQDKLASILKPS